MKRGRIQTLTFNLIITKTIGNLGKYKIKQKWKKIMFDVNAVLTVSQQLKSYKLECGVGLSLLG